MKNLIRILILFLSIFCTSSAFSQDKNELEEATSLMIESQENANSGNYNKAIQLCTEALNILERTIGKEHPYYAGSLDNLANYNSALGNYNEGIRLGTEALNILERTIGKEHPYYAGSLGNLAISNYALGNYNEAIRLGTEALNILERTIGKEHPYYAESLRIISISNSALGNYNEGIRLGTEALNILERTIGKEHPVYSRFLSIIADSNCALGNYNEAIRLGTEALNILERTIGKEHPEYAESLRILADSNYALGNLNEAIRLGTEALNILERTIGKEHPDYARFLRIIAMTNCALGNYNEAIRPVTEALDIQERVLGKDHPNYASSLSILAGCNYYLGNYAEALRLGTEALNILERTIGKEHPGYAASLKDLADSNYALGNYNEGIRLGTEALNILERTIGKEHPGYARSLRIIAMTNCALGNYNEALRLGTEALNILERTVGEEHPYILSIKTLLFFSFLMNNDIKNAEQNIVDINNLAKNYVRSSFLSLTSSERFTFWNTIKNWFEIGAHYFAYYINSQSIISSGYDMALFAKGILLNSERDFSDLIMESNDQVAIELFGKLRTTRSMLNKLYEKPIAERFMDTDSLENVALQLERKLIEQSKIYGDFTHNMTIDWKDVQKKLRAKDIAIEFVNFSTENDSVMYAAYVLDSKMKNPEYVALFKERQLSEIQPRDYYKTSDLSRLIWGKLDNFINDADNIYFAPAGELYNIAIESLPDYRREGLISDKQNFYRLSSTRQLAVIKDENQLEKVALYGGLKYDSDVDVLVNDAGRYPKVNRDFSNIFQPDSLGLRSGVSELPASKIEVENISRAFIGKSITPQLFTGIVGTEASFKNLSGKGINIMHIATHGFYWTQREVRRMNNMSFLQMGDNAPRFVEDKALSRSGLMLAGANNALSGKPLPENIQDGILTAKEISSLDLRKLDLVVLSACQTGLGEITGDGVYGLQRGFKKAGANSLLMSLWKVDDNATQMLMSKFYELFLAGKSKLEALSLAQKYLREYVDDTTVTTSENNDSESRIEIIKPYADPIYWAAFILLDAFD